MHLPLPWIVVVTFLIYYFTLRGPARGKKESILEYYNIMLQFYGIITLQYYNITILQHYDTTIYYLILQYYDIILLHYMTIS